MGIELAKAFVTVRADSSRVRGDLSRAKGPIRAAVSRLAVDAARVGAAWQQAAGSIGAAGTRIALATAAVGGFVIKTFADFERTMIQVGAVSQTLGTEDFPRLEAAARKAGATTEFTATQSAKAMENLALAGLKADEVLAALPATLELASAASIDIATAARISASQMRAFGLDAANLTRINDVLVATQARSNTNILELAEALKPVAPIAKTAGVSLEDTAAILAKMADSGFRGSIGGVALRRALINLAKPAGEAEKQLRRLGVQAVDPLFVKLQKIKVGVDAAANEAERLGLAAEIFGARAAGPMLSALEAGSDGLRSFSDELAAAAGLSGDIAAAKIDTLKGQLNILRSVIEDVVLTTGGKLNPTFRGLVSELQDFVGQNSDEIADNLATAIRAAALGAREAFSAFMEFLPALREAGKVAGEFLRPLLGFLREHPKLLGALIALKTTGFLGLNAAILDTTRALGTSIKVIGSYRLAVSALAVVVGTKLTLSLLGAAKAQRELNAAQARGDRLAKERQRTIDQKTKQDIEGTPLALRREELSKKLQQAERNRKGAVRNLRSALRGLRKEQERLAGGGRGLFTAFTELFGIKREDLTAGRRNAVRQAQADLAAYERRIRSFRAALEALPEGAERPVVAPVPGAPAGRGFPGPAAVPVPQAPAQAVPPAPLLRAGRSGFAEFGAKIQDALLQREQERLDQKRNELIERQLEIQEQILEATKENSSSGALT